MSDTPWARLRAPFPVDAVAWSVAETDEALAEALLHPYLRRRHLIARLDEAVGSDGWSVRFAAADGAVICTLEVGGRARGAVVDIDRPGGASAEVAADLALARAAEAFGMVAAAGSRRVPYDAETGSVLADDEDPLERMPSSAARAGIENAPDLGPDLAVAAAEARGVPAEGQRMIDRLVERLKDEGQGLPAARLLVRYGGYGKDPEAARELYRELRALLVRTGGAPEPKA